MYMLEAVVVSMLASASLARRGGCQGYGDCSVEREENCYKNLCLNATEIMQLAFDIGQYAVGEDRI